MIMKKLLLILLCLPLLFTSCSKSEGCIEGNCIDGYGQYEEQIMAKMPEGYENDLLWQLENNITAKDWVGTFIIIEERYQTNVELYNGARREQ